MKYFGRLILILICVILLLFSNCFVIAVSVKKTVSVPYGKDNLQRFEYSFLSSTCDEVKIRYPLSSIPVFVEKNRSFIVGFEAKEFDYVYVFISTAYEPVVDEIWLDLMSLERMDGIWHATVRIPQKVPEELYNLTVIIEVDLDLFSCSQPRAVSVVDEINDDFTFIHVTDFHVGDPRGLTENIEETIGFKSIKKCIEEINLLHPDFVIISGDLVFGQLYPFEYSREYKKCYELLQLFDVPTFLVPGNHDGYRRFREDGFDFWKEYFGALYYSFDYGNYHFIGVNSYDWPKYHRTSLLFIVLNWGGYVSDDQLQWIEHDLATANANLTFMFLHHNPLWDTKKDSLLRLGYYNRGSLMSLIEENRVDMVLAGHVHYDNVTVVNNTIYVTTTTPESNIPTTDGYWGYRLIEIRDGYIASYNYKDPKYSIPSYKLNCSKWISSSIALALVENDLETNITAHVQFVMPLNDYTVNDGEIILQRENKQWVELYITADIDKSSTVPILLSPVG